MAGEELRSDDWIQLMEAAQHMIQRRLMIFHISTDPKDYERVEEWTDLAAKCEAQWTLAHAREKGGC